MRYTVIKKMRFIIVNHGKWRKSKPRKLDKNVAAVTAVTTDEKKSQKIDDLLWRFQKKCQFKKNRKNYYLL